VGTQFCLLPLAGTVLPPFSPTILSGVDRAGKNLSPRPLPYLLLSISFLIRFGLERVYDGVYTRLTADSRRQGVFGSIR
jgi:hypothetical protein